MCDEEKSKGMVYYINGNDMESHRIRRRIRGIDQEMEETKYKLGEIRAAQGVLDEILPLLQRMQALALRGGVDPPPDYQALNRELQELKEEILRILTASEGWESGLINESMNAVLNMFRELDATVKKGQDETEENPRADGENS